jgi:hypothetical protein
LDFLFVLVAFGGGAFVLASFTGGFASAIAAGGRENHSLLANAGIGLVGWLAASAIWAAVNGSWPEELTGELLVLTFVCSVVFAWMLVRRERARTH